MIAQVAPSLPSSVAGGSGPLSASQLLCWSHVSLCLSCGVAVRVLSKTGCGLGWKSCSPAFLLCLNNRLVHHIPRVPLQLLIIQGTHDLCTWPVWVGSWRGGATLRRWVAVVTSLMLTDSGHSDGHLHPLCHKQRPQTQAQMELYGSQRARRWAAQQCARRGEAEAGRGNDPLKAMQPGGCGAKGRCPVGWSLSLGVTQQWKQQTRVRARAAASELASLCLGHQMSPGSVGQLRSLT